MGRGRRSGARTIMHFVHFGAWMGVGDRRTARRICAMRWRDAGESMIARRCCRVARADLCTRSAWLYAGERMIARDSRSTGSEFRTSRSAGTADVVALRRNRGYRRSGMRANDSGAAQLAGMDGRRDGRMAVIVVE